MTTDSQLAAHDHDAPDTATDHAHDTSWSANFELPWYAADHDLVAVEAAAAIEYTTTGHHVNLVIYGDHGHPEMYLYDTPVERFDGVMHEHAEQCGCGGHVTRVYVE